MIRFILYKSRLLPSYPTMRPLMKLNHYYPTQQWAQQTSHVSINTTFSYRSFSSNHALQTNRELEDWIFSVHGVKLEHYSIYSLKAVAVLERNSKEQLDEKLFMLKDRLPLSSEELRSLLVSQGMLLNLSIEELKERINLFREGWHCSSSQIKEVFISQKARKIQSQSYEELKIMLETYKGWEVKEEDLRSKLFCRNCWRKYQKQIGKTKKHNNNSADKEYDRSSIIRAFFVNNFNIKVDSFLINRFIIKKVFKINDHEELKEKINYFSSKLQLSQEGVVKFIVLPPEFWNDSFEDLRQKMEYFENTLKCSLEELKDLFLSRKSIVCQSIDIIKFQHAILPEEYNLPIETIRKVQIVQGSGYSPIHLLAMVGILAERKIVLTKLFPDPKHFIYSVTMTPPLLWMPSQRLYDLIDTVIEEGLASSIDDPNLHRVFYGSPFLVNSSKSVLKSRVRHIFTLLTQSESTHRKSEVNTKADIQKRFPNIAADQAVLDEKYQDCSEDKVRRVIDSKTSTKNQKMQSEENTQKEGRFADAFFMNDRSLDDEQQQLLLISEEFDSSKIDLLKGIGHEDTTGSVRKEGLREGQGVEKNLAMKRALKVIKGLNASEEQAKKLMTNSIMLGTYFRLVLAKRIEEWKKQPLEKRKWEQLKRRK